MCDVDIPPPNACLIWSATLVGIASVKHRHRLHQRSAEGAACGSVSCALVFSGIGAASVMVPQTPQLRRQLCVIHSIEFGRVQLPLATSSPQRVFISKQDSVWAAGPPRWPFRDAGVRPVAFSQASSSRVRVGLTPISRFIFRADAFIAASFSASPSSWASATHDPTSTKANNPHKLRASEAVCMTAAAWCVDHAGAARSGPRCRTSSMLHSQLLISCIHPVPAAPPDQY